MAKPKGQDIVGWTNRPTAYEASHVSIVAEKDVDQKKRRGVGEAETWSNGHTVRQLGLAKRDNGDRMGVPIPPTYQLYTHSQVSNGTPYLHRPPAFVGMNREDLEWLVAVLLRELYGETPAVE